MALFHLGAFGKFTTVTVRASIHREKCFASSTSTICYLNIVTFILAALVCTRARWHPLFSSSNESYTIQASNKKIKWRATTLLEPAITRPKRWVVNLSCSLHSYVYALWLHMCKSIQVVFLANLQMRNQPSLPANARTQWRVHGGSRREMFLFDKLP